MLRKENQNLSFEMDNFESSIMLQEPSQEADVFYIEDETLNRGNRSKIKS